LNGQEFSDQYVDREALRNVDGGNALQVRSWEPGDQLQVLGTSRPVKIKSLFQENRVLLWERRNWPVLVAGRQIIWAFQFGVDERFAPGDQTENLLRIHILHRSMSDASASESKQFVSTSLKGEGTTSLQAQAGDFLAGKR
jgi:tRNA(Ile)-lysidine synthetase-like protein